VSSLEVTVTAGNTGPVIVLAGEADYAGIAELNMALEGELANRRDHLDGRRVGAALRGLPVSACAGAGRAVAAGPGRAPGGGTFRWPC
jgi:hypothetical protein